ncbi:DivIVA domain-containing protein [Lawsonibacter celer]|jgi:cell division initiation protein|uniref:DivIVA domain-containing protein n=1 Tax=Lawsonibacter celer TaxID=2986526 RepID=UPI001647B507|nr:DivIVA domain-containing protein [Lawsonibacter celer]
MLTPQEVSERAFSKASFGGYNMAMVDEFLDLLTEDYTTLYKENATLKAKMKVLVDKVEEYRSTEDAMRKTLLTAQRMADELVAQAEAKKSDLLKNAEKDAQLRMAELEQEIRNEQARLAAAQASTASYVNKLKELYQHELDYLGGLSSLTAVTAAPPADSVAQAADDISAAVDRLVEEETETEPTPTPEADDSLYAELRELSRTASAGDVEEEDREEEDDVTAPTRRIDFEHLQFGKDYEIK